MLSRFAGKSVSVVGKVTTFDGQHGTMQTGDGTTVNFSAEDGTLVIQGVYEFHGSVSSDMTLSVGDMSAYSDNFDLESHSRMLKLAHNPKYSSMFWG